MFCINCGSNNVSKTTKPHSKVFVERGVYNEQSGQYSEEAEAIVLECSECDHEMIDLSS